MRVPFGIAKSLGLGRVLSGPGHRGWAACLSCEERVEERTQKREEEGVLRASAGTLGRRNMHSLNEPANRKTRWPISE
jgi:hypothetical protein